MSEGSSNQPRFCTNCGHQIRSDTTFCVSCGASLAPNQEPTESRSIPSGPSPSEQFGSMAASLKEGFQRLKARFSTASSNPSGNTWRGTPGRFLSWFRDIPVGAKFALAGFVGIPGLIVLALLSPVVRIVAIIALIVSVAILIIRGVQRKSIREWGVIAVASLVLIPIFGGVSGFIYDSNSQPETVVGGSNPEPVPEPEYADTEALTEEEKDYLKRTASVRSHSDELWTRQFELFNDCVGIETCSFDYNVEMATNKEEIFELVANASQAASPSGYEESHAALVSELEVSREMIELMAFGEITQSTYDAMYNELTSYRVESLDAMPEAGERFYAEQQLEN